MATASAARHLIVNADDFGLTNGINRGIVQAHERGIVTSASLMVRYPAAAEAARYARALPALSIGLHFEAAEWRFRDGGWSVAYEVIDPADPVQIRAELETQLARFQQLMGRTPTHLDSHQHLHMREPAKSILLEAAERMAVPLRGCSPVVRYCGDFYGQTGEGEPFPDGISFVALSAMIDQLEPGWTEIGCHPGYAGELDSVYLAEREQELRVLCSPEAKAALQRHGLALRSFRDLETAPGCRRRE